MNKIKFILAALMINIVNATYIPKPAPKSGLSDLVLSLKSIVQQLCFVYGIGMVIVGLYKYKLYRENPEANPLGRVYSSVAAGAALIGVSFVPVAEVFIY